MRSGVVTFAGFLCILATCSGAFIGTSSGGSKDDRNEVQGGYSLRQPDLPALYSAPKSHQEQDAQDNEVDLQSSTDRDSTTTEVYFDDREEDTSEDYPYTTLATQSPHDAQTSDYVTATTPAKPYSSLDNQGGYGGYVDSRRKDKLQNSSQQLENPLHSKPLDQQQIENHQFPQHAHLPPPTNYHGQSQQQQPITSQYGPPNSLPQPEHRRIEEIRNQVDHFNPQQKNYENNQYSQTNELHGDFQPAQYLPPKSVAYSNLERYEQPEQPQAVKEPQRHVTALEITRDYGTPVAYNSQSTSPRESQEQEFFPQGEHAGQQRSNNYEAQPNPTAYYLPQQHPIQQQELPLQQQQQQHPIQQQQYTVQQQQAPQHQLAPQQYQQQRQQQLESPQQYQQQSQQQPEAPQQYQQQGQQQLGSPQQYQQQGQRQPEAPQQYQQHSQQQQQQKQQYHQRDQEVQQQQQQQQLPQQQQQPQQEQQSIQQQQPLQKQYYSSPTQASEPQNLAPKPQSDNQYLPPRTNDFQQSAYPSQEKNERGVAEPENRGNKIQSTNDIFEFDGFHDNDNVVDAELLQRVQQIIEEHERQQKEIQEKLRRANEANEVFFQNAQKQIESIRNDLTPDINTRNEGPYENNGQAHAYNRLNDQGFYSGPSTANNNNSIRVQNENENEKQRSLQSFPTPTFPDSQPLDKSVEAKNYLNSPYGVPGIQFNSDPFRQEQTFPGNQNGNVNLYPSTLSPTEDSRNQFHPESQSQYQQQNVVEGGIGNERQYESSARTYNEAQNQVQWPTPTISNTANGPQSNAESTEAGQRSNENPSAIKASSTRKPQIEYQKAILTEHFVETKPEFPSRARGDSSRQFPSSSLENRSNSPIISHNSGSFPSQLASSQGQEPSQFQSPNPSIYNRGNEQQTENLLRSAYFPENELDSRPVDPNQFQNQQTENSGNQIGNSHFYNNQNEQSQNRESNSNEEVLHFSNQYPRPYSQPAPINYKGNSGNEGERVQVTSTEKPDQPQQTNLQGFYQPAFAPQDNSRTIVVHEVPYASVPGVSNRAVINPNEQSAPLNIGNEQQNPSPDNSFHGNPSSENEINFSFSNNNNPTPYQQQTFQGAQANLQYQPQQGSQQSQEGNRGYIQPTVDTSSNSQYLTSNEILSPGPKPVYGIPLAPVVDPASLTSIDQRDSSVVLSSQISFGEIGSLANPEPKTNPNDNINIVSYYPILPSHQSLLLEQQQILRQQPQLQQIQQQQPQQQYQQQLQQIQQQQLQNEHFQHQQLQNQQIQVQQLEQQPQLQVQQYNVQQQQPQPEKVPLINEYYPQAQLDFTGTPGSDDFRNNQVQVQLQPEILSQYTDLAGQGGWPGDSISVVSAVSPVQVPASYGLPLSDTSSVNKPVALYGVPTNHTSVPSSSNIYNLNDATPQTTIPLVSNSVSPSQRGYFYARRNRSLKQKFSSPVRSPLVTSFTVKSNNTE